MSEPPEYVTKVTQQFLERHTTIGEIAERLRVNAGVVGSAVEALTHLEAEHPAIKIIGGRVRRVATNQRIFVPNEDIPRLERLFQEFLTAPRACEELVKRKLGPVGRGRLVLQLRQGKWPGVAWIPGKVNLVHKSILEATTRPRKK